MPDTRESTADRLEKLINGVLSGDRRSVSQAITAIENGGAIAQQILSGIYLHTGQAHVIGVTGSPGTGKSTLVAAMAQHYRARGDKVGIVAVDPTSPFSGGAILGDRIRMRNLTGDPGVFIRSMATRGHLGGLATTTSDVVYVLDAAQYPIVIVETVGVGQAEVDIACMAHTVIVVEAPGLGDDIQALKAGLMEIADIFVVNKSDLSGADAVVNVLQSSIEMASGKIKYTGHHQVEPGNASDILESTVRDEGWQIPVKEVTALQQEGIAELIQVIDAHKEYLHSSGIWKCREKGRIETNLEGLIKQIMLQRLMAQLSEEKWRDLIENILARTLDPQTAAKNLVDELGLVSQNS